MTTKQQLEAQVSDLKNDVDVLLATLASINEIIKNEKDSHYAIGAIHGTISVAGIRVFTLDYDSYKAAAGVRPGHEVFA